MQKPVIASFAQRCTNNVLSLRPYCCLIESGVVLDKSNLVGVESEAIVLMLASDSECREGRTGSSQSGTEPAPKS